MNSGTKKENNEQIGFYLLTGWIITTLLWWSFAFAPITSEVPEWLKRAQEVCFGSLPNGLPNSGGWLLLIGGPLMLLFALLIGFMDELKKAFYFISNSQFAKIVYSILLVFTMWQSLIIIKKIKNNLTASITSFEKIDLSEFPENYPQTSKPLPQFTHISQLGTKISSIDAKGKVGYITFVFSHCATICPTLTKTIINVLSKFPSEKTYAWFITLDPWRDTPSMISEQAKIWHLPKNAFLLSDKPESIQTTLDLLNVPRSRNIKTGEVTHPGLVYLVNQKGEITYMFNNPSQEWLLKATKKILDNPTLTENKKNAEQNLYSHN